MILAGIYHTLTVARISDPGLYLVNSDADEVLLPNRYVTLDDKIGDQVRVFIYHDSEDRLVASRKTPLATVGEVAAMKVVDKTVHGAFLDWGIEAKDLFLPNRNMVGRLEPGESYVVYVYRDDITGRAVATMKLSGFISNTELSLKRGEQVDIIIALKTEQGYRAVINNRNWGMLYHNQLFRPVSIGDRMTAYVRKIAEDGRVDLSLQQEGFNEVKTSAERLLKLIIDNGGTLPLHDDSEPERVKALTGMSKKVFKRSVGYLMKRSIIIMDQRKIALMPEDMPAATSKK